LLWNVILPHSMSAPNFIQVREGHIFFLLTWYGMTPYLQCSPFVGAGPPTCGEPSFVKEQELIEHPAEARVSMHCPEPQSHSIAVPSPDTARDTSEGF
jgi:hypothetical protein